MMAEEAAELREKLIHTYINDYMEKVFYFSLKKTSNEAEAEDLTAEISVQIVSQLHRRHFPQRFSAWVWKIARNRYSTWAACKHKRSAHLSALCMDELDLAEAADVGDTVIRGEQLSLLRRELAFISKEYRDILISYYIENRKVAAIARSLELPEGTVKTKLFRSRTLLKEGMNMAREFGARSYHPEDVSFSASGSQPSGLPWKAVKRKIPKNILLQSSNNPSTIEELSMELGIAAPYMEEEVSLLEEATLLKKLDNSKYITNFFISDMECQMDVYLANRRTSKERSALLDRMISDLLPMIKQLNIVRNGMSDDDFKWLLLLSALDHTVQSVKGYDITCRVKRNDGGSWGFMGEEKGELPERVGMGHNGNGTEKATSWAYKIGDYNMFERAGEMGASAALLLCDIIEHKRPFSSLTAPELDVWKGIDGRFAHVENDAVIPDVGVFESGVLSRYHKLIEGHGLYAELLDNCQKTFDALIAVLKKHSSPVLLEQLHYYASMYILETRMMMVHDEVEAERLKVPKDPEKSTAAMYLTLDWEYVKDPSRI
jgi:RNA polymerase sigma factor (sigma-70 family)